MSTRRKSSTIRKNLKKGSVRPSFVSSLSSSSSSSSLSSLCSSSSSSCKSPVLPSKSNSSSLHKRKKESSSMTSTKKKTSQSKSIPNRKRKSNKVNNDTKKQTNSIEKSDGHPKPKKKKVISNKGEKDSNENSTPNKKRNAFKRIDTGKLNRKKSKREDLIHGLLISITTIERITAIEELCNNLESSNTNPEISEESNNCIDDYDDGIAPALCKQIMFSSGIIPACCASDKYELHEDQEEDIRIYWKELKLLLRAMELLLSKHWSPKTLDQIFKKYGDFMISSVVDVINQCMDNTDTLQINKCYIIPTIISGTVILKQCSRGSKSMRKRTLHLEGLLPLLIHLLNGTWLQNNSATSESKTATNTIRGNAMGTIANLPVDQPAMKYLTDFPLLLDSVTEILCEESGNLKEYAIVFMVNMTYSKYCVELMIKTKPKIILSIAKLIRNETNVKMEIFALRIIENFMKSDHAAISVEKYALENLLLLFQIRKIKYDQMKKISIDHQHMEDENLFRASKILLQLSNTASVAVMINKPDIIPKIVGATFFFNCDNDCENNSKLNSYAKNPSEKLQISLQLHVIKMLTNFTFAIKSPLSPGYKDLIQSLTKLLSRKKYQEKICWLLLHQIGLDDDYDHNDDNDSSRQLSIISTHGLLENLSSIILDNDSTMLSSLRASAILLNLSSSNLCHPTMINNKTCMSAIINRSKETKQTSESDTPFEKEESKMLLTRTAINLVLNKNNQKKLEKYHEKIMQVLVVAASPRKMAFEGAKEAIWTLLQD